MTTTETHHVVGHTSTYSKAAYYHLPHYPTLFYDAHNCIVEAARDIPNDPTNYPQKSFYDFTASLGAVMNGYAATDHPIPPALPGPTRIEEEVASLLLEPLDPSFDRVRFAKNGSDVTEAAVRLARCYKEYPVIITNSYHGSHSDLVAATPNKEGGILTSNISYLYHADTPAKLLEYIRRLRPAAVIMEPLTPHCQDWNLKAVREACNDCRTILIFDEIITGWRLRPGSACPEVTPDLYCFGKAIANGMPLAALVGPSHLMDYLLEKVFMSNTAAGETHSLYSARHFLLSATPEKYNALNQWGNRLHSVLQGIVTGYPTRWTITLPQGQHHPFLSALAERHILVGRDFFSMFSHLNLTPTEQSKILSTIATVREELFI